MKCNKVQEWISLEMDDRLAPQHVPLLQQHLADCAACRMYREELRIGQRMLHATEPKLSANFDWKLQLRLNHVMREAARDASYPWQRSVFGWRRWLARAGVSATVGLTAMLAFALLTPYRLTPGPDSGFQVAAGEQSLRLPMQTTSPSAPPLYDTSRRPLNAALELARQPAGLGLQRRVSGTSGFGTAYWSGANERDLLRIRQLEQDVEALRRRLAVRERQVRQLEAKLDSLTAPVVDRTQAE